MIAFFATAVVVIVTPGPDTALTIRNTLVGGRGAGVRTAFGVFTGNMVWATATSVGLGALLLASEPVFVALKWVGAAYLVYLGAHALRDAVRRRPSNAHSLALPLRRPYRQGLLSNLANPKIAIFYTSLIPQFAASFPGLIGLAALFALMGLVWLSGYSVLVAKTGDVLRRSGVSRALEAVTGTALVALGVRLATEPR